MNKLIMATAAIAMTAGVAYAGSHSVVRMGTEGAYPPWNFINDNGEVDGFERELGDELCKRAGLTCEWVTNEWDSIIPNLTSGNYDTIIAGMSITDERDQVIDFSGVNVVVDRMSAPYLGGATDRFGLTGELGGEQWKAMAYVVDYDFELFSNFTYLLDDPVFGDQFEQVDQRRIYGLHIDGSAFAPVKLNWGGDIRYDDIEQVVDVIGKGAAQSWQMDNRAVTMAAGEFDFGFAVDWMRKDLGIALEQGKEMGLSLPVTALVDQFYSEVQALGGGRWDTSSLLVPLERMRRNTGD